MKIHEIQHTLAELTKEYYAIGRTLDFEEWLTAQCMQLQKERVESIGRASALEEWLSDFRDQLKKTSEMREFNRNTLIGDINELLNENS